MFGWLKKLKGSRLSEEDAAEALLLCVWDASLYGDLERESFEACKIDKRILELELLCLGFFFSVRGFLLWADKRGRDEKWQQSVMHLFYDLLYKQCCKNSPVPEKLYETFFARYEQYSLAMSKDLQTRSEGYLANEVCSMFADFLRDEPLQPDEKGAIVFFAMIVVPTRQKAGLSGVIEAFDLAENS